jgi:hypothetical protein
LQSFSNKDGSINPSRTVGYYKTQEEIARFLALTTRHSMNVKSILYQPLPYLSVGHLKSRPNLGQLVFVLPDRQQSRSYGFVYFGKKLLKPQFKDYSCFGSSFTRDEGEAVLADEFVQTLGRDFVPHPSYPIPTDALRRPFPFRHGATWIRSLVQHAILKRHPTEQKRLDELWADLKDQCQSVPGWMDAEELWNAADNEQAIKLLQRSIANSMLSWMCPACPGSPGL